MEKLIPGILIADRDTILVQAMQAALEQDGYSIFTATTGSEALLKFERHQPDLVIVDSRIQGINCLDLCRAIRAQSGTPIFVTSMLTGEADRVMALEVGADQLISKPFTTRELRARVQAIFRRQALDQE